MSVGTMARKASGKRSAPKRIILAMKGSDEWASWLDRAASHSGLSVSVFIDRAVKRYARAEGFTEPPPKR